MQPKAELTSSKLHSNLQTNKITAKKEYTHVALSPKTDTILKPKLYD